MGCSANDNDEGGLLGLVCAPARGCALRGACLGLDTEIVSCPCLFGGAQGVQSTTFGADLTAEAAIGKAE